MFKNLQMDFNLNHLRSFMTVARIGNLSAAARELGTTQPNLGRQMTALANEVGMELFVRHSRGMDLTQQGKEFFDLCQDIVGRLAQGTDIIRWKNAEPQGNFHFLSGMGIQELIIENIAILGKSYPNMSFSFSSIVNAYQLQIGEADAGVIPAFQSIKDPNFTQRHLYDTSMRVFASPYYLQEHPMPKSLEDLRYHKVIVYASEGQEIELNKQIITEKSKVAFVPFLKVNTAIAMRASLLSSVGVGCYAYQNDLVEKGLLVDVFPNLPDQIVSYHYVYHRRLEGSPKIEAFYEFLKDIAKVWEPPIGEAGRFL